MTRKETSTESATPKIDYTQNTGRKPCMENLGYDDETKKKYLLFLMQDTGN